MLHLEPSFHLLLLCNTDDLGTRVGVWEGPSDLLLVLAIGNYKIEKRYYRHVKLRYNDVEQE